MSLDRRFRRWMAVAFLTCAAVALVCCIGTTLAAQTDRPSDDGPDTDRQTRRLNHTLVELGSVESVSAVELRSELAEPTRIISIVPEGTRVKEGDLVVQLDSTAYEDRAAQQRAILATAEAQQQGLREEREASLESLSVLVHAAKKRLEIALLHQRSYLAKKGEYQVLAGTLQREVSVAQDELASATQLRQQLIQMAKETKKNLLSDIAAAQSAMTAARARVSNAMARLALLEEFEKPREVAQRELTVLEARTQLTRTVSEQRRSERTIASQLATAQVEVESSRRALQRLEQQIVACRILAAQEGLVVYANQYSRRGGPADVAIEPGAMMRPRQSIVRIPDLSRLQLRVGVNETKITQVRQGQTSVIQIDGLADVKIQGRVSHVQQQPNPTTWLSGGVKQYDVLVSLVDPPKTVRLGMTGFATIQVEPRSED